MKWPKRVTIELTNRCNRSCSECPRHKTDYPLGNMNLGLFLKIVEELPAKTTVVPFFRGESTLHPKFPQMMQKLQKFSEVQFATNGDDLRFSRRQAIYDTCSFVSISLHKFMFPKDLNNGVLGFLYDAPRTLQTQVSILQNMVPDSKRKPFIQQWLRHADQVRLYVEHSREGFGSVQNPPVDNGEACKKPFEEMVVYWNGQVALCNHDWNRHCGLGDLNTDSVKQVWNGELYKSIRRVHTGQKRRFIPACRDCDYWTGTMLGDVFTRTNKWS